MKTGITIPANSIHAARKPMFIAAIIAALLLLLLPFVRGYFIRSDSILDSATEVSQKK